MRRVKREQRTERVALRLTPSELALYELAAKYADEDVSTILRRGGTIEARGIVARVEAKAKAEAGEGRKRGRAGAGAKAGGKGRGAR
jgi:hypothetical protein